MNILLVTQYVSVNTPDGCLGGALAEVEFRILSEATVIWRLFV